MNIKRLIPVNNVTFLLPVIFISLWQFFACILSVGTHSFSSISSVSFFLAVFASISIGFSLRTGTVYLQFCQWIGLIALAILATIQFVSSGDLQILDAFGPVGAINLVNQAVRGHFPVSYADFPEHIARYNQGFSFLYAVLVRITNLSIPHAVMFMNCFFFFYFVLLVQIVSAKYCRPDWFWFPAAMIFMVRSLQVGILSPENFPLSILETFGHSSWPVSMCVFLAIVYLIPKKSGEYVVSGFLVQLILILTLITLNAAIFSVITLAFSLMLLLIPAVYRVRFLKLKWYILCLFAAMLLWMLPQYIPSVFYSSDNFVRHVSVPHYRHPVGIQFYIMHILRNIMLSGPISIGSLVVFLWVMSKNSTNYQVRENLSLICLGSLMMVSLVLVVILGVTKIHVPQSAHEFSRVWMICALIFVSSFFSDFFYDVKFKNIRNMLVFSVALSLFGPPLFPQPLFASINIMRNIKPVQHVPYDENKKPYADVVAFLKSQKSAPLLYFHDSAKSGIHSDVLFITSFSGGFIRNCFENTSEWMSDSGRNGLKYSRWCGRRLLSEIKRESYHSTWIIMKNQQQYSFESYVNKFNKKKSRNSKIEISELKKFSEYTLAKINI